MRPREFITLIGSAAAVWPLSAARPAVKWEHHRNLRNRPLAPAKTRGRVQVGIRRAFIASGAEVLSSSAIYEWTHPRRRLRRKKLPYGIYWRTLQALRAMCEPIERVPPYGAWLWRLKDGLDLMEAVRSGSTRS